MDARPINSQSEVELAAVLELVKTVYRFEMPPEVYRWRFLANPFGDPLVTLLWDDEVLVGHYAASPMVSWLGGPLQSAQSMTTMTHADYRNRGVFTELARDLYARMRARGVTWVWGFPNTQSHYGFRTKLGWRDVALLFTMTRTLVLDDAGDAALIEQFAAPEFSSRLFERSDDGRLFPSRRDHQYLSWRYTQNPTNRYSFLYPPGSSDVLFVVKEYVTNGQRALELVDYLHGRNPEIFGSLLREVIRWARSRGYAMVRTWMAVNDPAFVQLEKLGFVPREPLAYFGGRTFGEFPLGEASWSHDHVAITMGDSDNY